MKQKYLIKNIGIVNEGRITTSDVLIADDRIEKIAPNITADHAVEEINGEGKFLLPGAIDDQVHFREPGLTHKATIYTEAKAAVAGGVTSFMEMPNTVPPVFTQELLEDKYSIAANTSLANYSFYMGTSNDNLDEVLRTNEKKNEVCGVKIFMGSSTGGLLVDNYLSLDKLFGGVELLIATHCEEERMILENFQRLKAQKGVLEPSDHPLVRDEEECFESSFKAVQLAMRHNTRLHILHISTEKELQLFTNMLPLKEKRITAEVCVHHLWFDQSRYEDLGAKIKCNPAIKSAEDREALLRAVVEDRIDVIATDVTGAPKGGAATEWPQSWQTMPHGVRVGRYIDAGFARLEFEKLWSRVWQVAARLDELPETGDFTTYDIGDQSVIVVSRCSHPAHVCPMFGSMYLPAEFFDADFQPSGYALLPTRSACHTRAPM